MNMYLAISFLYIGAVISQTTSQNCNEIQNKECESFGRPVCGNDFITYNNTCHFEKAKCSLMRHGSSLDIDYRRPCCSWSCDWQYNPVCSSNGKTHVNKCQLKYHSCVERAKTGQSLYLVHIGECADPCARTCSSKLRPVCGSDGLTYHNPCFLGRAQCRLKKLKRKLGVAYNGACYRTCTPEKKCPVTYDPVCGSDGQTYGNDCELNTIACHQVALGMKESLELASRGECNNTCVTTCPTNYKPVCGTNYRTYLNNCYLRRADCLNRMTNSGPRITQQSGVDGACPYEDQLSVCIQSCPDLDSEVCAANAHTYVNQCELEKTNCLYVKSGFQALQMKHKGPCMNSCARSCPLTYQPRCGTDFNLYRNACFLKMVACNAYIKMQEDMKEAEKGSEEKATSDWWPLKTFYLGECRANSARVDEILVMKECDELQPICGNDGVTYSNLCHIKVANIMKQEEEGSGIEPKHHGICREDVM